MKTGVVFDIKEFAVHDGPGIRTTVFMKGCPLACTWCHNPEGIATAPQTLCGQAGKRIVGETFTSRQLAERLNRQADILNANEGGVTFSGGEPLLQAAFVAEVIESMENTHVLLDTSGYSSERDFRLLTDRVQRVYFDLKLVDDALHRRYTGHSNGPILKNLQALDRAGVPFVIRVPLIPGVTDTDRNLTAIAKTVRGLDGLVRVDLLPYNPAAGAKYQAAGRTFEPGFDERQPPRATVTIFEQMGVTARVA